MGAAGGGKSIPLAADIRPFFTSEAAAKQGPRMVQYVALIGMPAAACRMALRHDVHFNWITLNRWRRAGGPLGTFAALLQMRRPKGVR